MPIEGLYWSTDVRAMEIHVLAGTTSADLRIQHLLFQTRDANHDIQYQQAAEYFITNSDVTLKFTIADASKKPGLSTRDFSLLGIRLNTDSGEVTVGPNPNPPAQPLPALAPLFPQNFLVEVTATNSGAAEPLKEMIRIHIHKSIAKIWLTPSTMKLRPRNAGLFPETTPVRFGLRARFDDDTVGDITDWVGVEWKTTRGAATTNNIDASDGTLTILAGDSAAAPITVAAKLTAFPALGTVTATLRVIEPWKPSAPIEARLVPGGGWPKPFALEAVPNVLFVPDGFPAGSDPAFFTYVNSLVAFIKKNPLCKPYDVLADSINFWAAFIASDQQGITWGSEVFARSGVAGDPLVFALPKPVRPLEVPVVPIWDLDRLIYEVGLPKPSDRPGTARTDAGIMSDWDTLFGTGYHAHLPADPGDLTGLIDNWRALGTRRILDDVDTPLGVMSGAARVDFNHDLITLNPDRMTRERLDDLVAAIRDKDVATSGLQLNNIWTDDSKRNYDLVCIVTLGQGREVNADGYFMLSQTQKDLQTCTVTGVNDIVPAALFLKATADPAEPRVFVHELSHSFDLGDEYGGFNDRPLFPAEVEHDHRTECNLQSPTSLKVAGDITGEEIKWRWPRIRWAAEIIGALQDEGAGMFSAPIRMSHAFGFPVGEIVHLRFRDINFAWRDVHYDDQSSYLIKLPLVSVPLKLVETFDTGAPPVKNVRLHVEPGVAFPYPAGSTVQAANLVAKFPAGSIVYQPTKAPAGVFDAATYPYAELIAKNVMEQVTFLHAALGHTNSDLSLPELPSVGSMTTIRKGFPNASLPFMVALYEGGSGNATGIFHPTGSCVMSDQDSGSRFCHVCKYVLVDAIDPSRHLFIDPDSDEIYPQE
ncbi:MAG TPA: hypothetical protein VL225_09230 [Vicinamibacterales bacterium]|nr:hypothetical protein [Vicinamibacterales bacterium]